MPQSMSARHCTQLPVLVSQCPPVPQFASPMHATQWPSVELQYGVRPPHMPSPLQGLAAVPAVPPPGVVVELPPPPGVVPELSPPLPGVVPELSPPPPGVVPELSPPPDVVLLVEPPVPEELPPLLVLPVPPAESLLPQPLIANANMTPTVPTST
jgi:protein TonB